MTDASNNAPMEAFDRGNPARRCTAHRGNGDRCRKWAIRGGTVCATHGGRAKQVREKAQRRLSEAADRMAKALLGMATDANVSETVRLAAIRDALSRAGVTEKQAIEVEVGPSKPYEAILERLASGGSRAEWRRSQGFPDDTPPALAAADPDAVVDAEIVTESDQQTYAHPMTPVTDDWQPDEPLGSSFDPLGRSDSPPDELLTLNEAVIRAAAMNSMATAGHARLHRPQRALPPGRSG
ncbi:hypothetical protein [Mycobacterium sp. Z3061]|uniref:hypothetical protein n=1 Tax=Mycobacterium sp. Z3061 TaxID=3073562 RepID=UPI0028738067|nr:hypothetical protein [Mycobacterium sp. Z3061]